VLVNFEQEAHAVEAGIEIAHSDNDDQGAFTVWVWWSDNKFSASKEELTQLRDKLTELIGE